MVSKPLMLWRQNKGESKMKPRPISRRKGFRSSALANSRKVQRQPKKARMPKTLMLLTSGKPILRQKAAKMGKKMPVQPSTGGFSPMFQANWPCVTQLEAQRQLMQASSTVHQGCIAKPTAAKMATARYQSGCSWDFMRTIFAEDKCLSPKIQEYQGNFKFYR